MNTSTSKPEPPPSSPTAGGASTAAEKGAGGGPTVTELKGLLATLNAATKLSEAGERRHEAEAAGVDFGGKQKQSAAVVNAISTWP